MATNTSVCSICDLRHVTSSSKHWCPECEEALCSDCIEHHSLSRATRSHKTIPISQYQTLPTSITDIPQFCIYHNEKYQQYCMKHECPICYKCIKEHRDCNQVVPLEDVCSEVKTSELFRDFEQSLKDVLDNIKRIREDREDNFKSYKTQKKKIAIEIDSITVQIIQYLHKLKEDFVKELEQEQQKFNSNTLSVISSLKDQEKEMDICSLEIDYMKEYATDLQTFLGMQTIKTKVVDNEKRLQSMVESKSLENVDIQISVDDKIRDILTTVKKFGSILINKTPYPTTSITHKKTKQAQIAVANIIQSISTISVDFKQKLDTKCGWPRGCCIARTGEFFFTNYKDNDAKIVALNREGNHEYTIQISKQYRAFDMEAMNENTVAVTTGLPGGGRQSKGISIVNLTKRKETKFIDLPGCPYGITHDGNSLICCVKNSNLHVVSCTDYSITTMSNTVLPGFSYISTHAGKIFFTNPDENRVSCRLYDGKHVWDFCDKKVLKQPRGISVDDKGNVFVVGTFSGNVIVITPDGKQYKEILNHANGLRNPSAISLDNLSNQLLVTNEGNDAYLYNISNY